MSLHDDLLTQLQTVAQVQLVASLRDDRLGFPNAGELHVFLPDIHLITEQRRVQAGFVYATNYLPLLESVVRSLAQLRTRAQPGGTVTLYQIGDLIDLWRQTDGLDPDLDVPSAIQNDHEDLFAALLDPALNTQFLLGNHDYDLYRFANFADRERYLFLSQAAIVMHGDAFDWEAKLPRLFNNFFVYLFSPLVQPNQADLAKMRPLNQQMRGRNRFESFIQGKVPAPLGTLRQAEEIPAHWNVQVDGDAPADMLTYLDAAQQRCAEANQRFGSSLKVAIIGHTHHARIAVRDSGSGLFTLIDCGAWIENCVTVDDISPRPNAQIAALGANEARIYQLAPLP